MSRSLRCLPSSFEWTNALWISVMFGVEKKNKPEMPSNYWMSWAHHWFFPRSLTSLDCSRAHVHSSIFFNVDEESFLANIFHFENNCWKFLMKNFEGNVASTMLWMAEKQAASCVDFKKNFHWNSMPMRVEQSERKNKNRNQWKIISSSFTSLSDNKLNFTLLALPDL